MASDAAWAPGRGAAERCGVFGGPGSRVKKKKKKSVFTQV